MAGANVDPAELRQFAKELGRFSSDISTLLSSLNARMRGLEQTWRDQEQKKFNEAFAQTAKMIGNFVEASQEHVQFLNKKAGIIEDYLKHR